MTTIHVENVFKRYAAATSEKPGVLCGLSADITEPSFITLIGPNGCGKTTLLNMIAGIVKPDAGKVDIRVQHDGSPHIGYVWQDYRASLLPWFDVGENLTLPLRIAGVPYKERRRVAQEAIKEFSAEIDCRQRISQLSGGQQQLVSLLRGTVAKPDILLLDEPTSALDQQMSWLIAFHIERIWMKHRVPAILVSHDVDQAIILADEIWIMSRGAGKISHKIKNELPRPRTVSMLTSQEHIHYRAEVIELLFNEHNCTNPL